MVDGAPNICLLPLKVIKLLPSKAESVPGWLEK
jgi:hypothetical protein